MNTSKIKALGTAILLLAIVLAGCNPQVSNIQMRRGYNARPVASGGPPVTNQALNAPAGVNTNQLPTGKIRITWNAVPGATGYRVYYGDPNDNTMRYYIELPASATSWEDDDALDKGHTYFYQVQAVNAAGQGPLSSVTQQAYTSSPPVSNPFLGTWRMVSHTDHTLVFSDHSVSLSYPSGSASGSYSYSGNHATLTLTYTGTSHTVVWTADITGANSLRIYGDGFHEDFTR